MLPFPLKRSGVSLLSEPNRLFWCHDNTQFNSFRWQWEIWEVKYDQKKKKSSDADVSGFTIADLSQHGRSSSGYEILILEKLLSLENWSVCLVHYNLRCQDFFFVVVLHGKQRQFIKWCFGVWGKKVISHRVKFSPDMSLALWPY